MSWVKLMIFVVLFFSHDSQTDFNSFSFLRVIYFRIQALLVSILYHLFNCHFANDSLLVYDLVHCGFLVSGSCDNIFVI